MLEILEDSHLISLAQTLVFSSQDSVQEFLERLYCHSERFPEMANVLLFTMFGKFFDTFCMQIKDGQEDLSIVCFEAVQSVMTDPNFEKFMTEIALNPFIMLSGAGEE